jgi:hypothetical protein
MKIALDPYMFRSTPLADLAALTAAVDLARSHLHA